VEIALSTVLYTWKAPLETAIAKAKRFGYDGVEIRASKPDAWPRDLKKPGRVHIKELLERHSLRAVSLTPDWADINLASSNPSMREESLRQVKEAIELAADLEAKYFTILPGRWRNLASPPLERAKSLSLESLNECVSFAEKIDVVLCLEGAVGQILEKEQDLIDAVEKIGSKHFRVAADTSHAFPLRAPISDYFRKLKRYIEIVHLADHDGIRRLPLGNGKIDFAEVFKVIEEIDYRGPFVIEVWNPRDPDLAAREGKAFVDNYLLPH